MKTLNIAARIHGRVLVRDVPDPAIVVAGFHGYMENAGIQMARLQELAGSAQWTLVSIQGLHRFYRGRSEEVVASWMTREDREDMISDNIDYADLAVESAAPPGVPIVTVGFSQGVAMAFRAGIRGRRRASGIVAIGGDVPPELVADETLDFPAVLLGGGERDEWYTAAKLEADVAALRARGRDPQTYIHPAGHEWTSEVSRAVSDFIQALATS